MFGRKIAILAAFLLGWAGAAAQVEFVAGAPQMVEAGTAFRVEFVLSVNDRNSVPSSFTAPDFAGLNVIAGPSESRGQSISIVNSQRTEKHIFTYTYVLSAPSEGRVTLGPASVTVDGQNHTTRPVQIEVVASGSDVAGQAAGGRPQASGTLAKDDVLIRIIPSRTTVYKGEPIRVQLKIYTRADLAGVQNARYPAFNGFWSQELDLVGEWRQETYNNKLYNTQVIREFLIFPQQAGTLSIEQFALSVVARIVTQGQRQSIFDDFFGGGPSFQDVPLELTAGPIPITVRELPSGAPAGFSGAVGQFRLEGGPGQLDIPANSSANFEVTISGSGNLPLIESPPIAMPTSFEAYAVKTTDNYTPGGANITGSKRFLTPFIPRAEGEYTIAPVEFSLTVMGDTQIGIEEDVMSLRYNVSQERYGHQVQAVDFRNQASSARSAAKNAKRAGQIGAFGSLLGTAASFAWGDFSSPPAKATYQPGDGISIEPRFGANYRSKFGTATGDLDYAWYRG